MVAASCWLTAACAASPRFDAYPASIQPGRHLGHIVLSDSKSRQYADELQSADGQEANFAGRFVLATWGCGASCVMGAAIDTGTGAVVWLPFTVCCWSREVVEPLEFKPGSRLLVVHGGRNEKGSGTHEYVFDGRAFTPLPVVQGVPR